MLITRDINALHVCTGNAFNGTLSVVREVLFLLCDAINSKHFTHCHWSFYSYCKIICKQIICNSEGVISDAEMTML